MSGSSHLSLHGCNAGFRSSHRAPSAPRPGARLLALLGALALMLALAGCGGAPVINPGTVSVSNPSVSSVQPGQSMSVTVSGMPTGTIAPSSVTITGTLVTSAASPASESISAPPTTFTTTATEVSGTGSVRTITFQIPAGIEIDAATRYNISVSGTTSEGQSFRTTTTVTITINPPARIVSISPITAPAGTFVDVTITGANTAFVQGQTQASFGAGTSIGNNSYDGGFGNVTVNSATSAVARVIISPTATVGLRNVIVRTGTVSATLANAFTVGNPNRDPLINIGGPYSGLAGSAVSFNASGTTDPDGDALTFTWNFGDNSTGSGSTPQHTYTAPGTYTVTLTVTDGKGGTATVNATVTIANPNTPPVANIGGPYSGVAGTAITFNASGSSDPDNDTLTYSWNFGDNATGSGVNPQHTFTQPGTYTVTLTVTDGRGGSVSVNTTVTVANPNNPPTASAGGPYTGQTATSLAFSGTGTDPDNDSLTFTWDFGDNSTGTGASTNHTYTTAGTYTVTLTVTDGKGGTATSTAQVTITQRPNTAPVAAAGGPYTGNVNQTITFNSTGTVDADGDTLTLTWDFGDNTAPATGAAPTHAYAAGGTYTVTLTVTDGAGGTTTTTAQVTITAPAQVTISTPVNSQTFNTTAITVTGTVEPPDSTVTVNGVNAVVTSGGSFTAENVTLREGVNIITAAAISGDNAGTATVSVNLDLTAPTVSIDTPSAEATVTAPQVTVTGMVNDIVTGTVNAEQVTVKVNGINATISNRSFSVPDVLLVQGLNTITVEATDAAGNKSTATRQVILADAGSQQHIIMVAGNNQSGVIGSMLPEPLVVQLLDADEVPVAERAVTFTVRKSDGILKALPEEGQELTVISDQNGRASVLFQLGTRTGSGVNEVVATSIGFAGEVVFSASSTGSAPTQITVVHGENQRGIFGQQLALPLEVIITDVGGNPVAGVDVTFNVEAGGGSLDEGGTTITKATNSDGKARVLHTLGLQEGTNNNVVSANFTGNTGAGVTFTSSALASGSVANTSVSGVVLDNAQTPIPNATAKIAGTELTALTDEQGRFSISNAPIGTVTLTVDGSTSTRPETFPFLSFLLQSLPGQDNTLNMPIYLPIVNTENSKMVGGPEEQVLTMQGVPGVAFYVAPNSATFPNGDRVGLLSISQVHADKVPMAPPNGSAPQVVWTLQPAGAKFDPPIRVQLPNTEGLAPGQVIELFQFDHDLEQFVSVGAGRVSPDGSVIVSDPGFGITKAGWGAAAPPPPPKNCTISCDDRNECTSDSVLDPPCTCQNTDLSGGSCGGQQAGRNSCIEAGECFMGVCLGQQKPAGTPCDDNIFCTEPDECTSVICFGKKIKDGIPSVLTFEIGVPDFISGIKLFAQKVGIAEEMDVTISGEQKKTAKCCELKKIKDLEDVERKVSLNAKLETDKLFIPSLSFDIRAVQIGVFAKVGASGSLSVTNSKEMCSDPINSCWGGAVTIGGSIEVGVAAQDAAKIVSISGSGQVGLQFEGGVNCKEVGYKLSVGELKVKATAEFFDGYISVGYERVLFEGAPLLEGKYQFPE